MRLRVAAGAALLALAAAALPASAAPSLLLISDPEGDANFSGINRGLPLPSQANMDLVSVTFDTVKRKKVATTLRIDLTLAANANTMPTASYGIIAEHSVCGVMRLQIYYRNSGPRTYGDLASCGSDTGAASTNAERHRIEFAPKVDGKVLRLEIPLKLMPKEFKVGTTLSSINAYTSNAEFVVAGYQSTDVLANTGVDTAVTETVWKIA